MNSDSAFGCDQRAGAHNRGGEGEGGGINIKEFSNLSLGPWLDYISTTFPFLGLGQGSATYAPTLGQIWPMKRLDLANASSGNWQHAPSRAAEVSPGSYCLLYSVYFPC